MGCIKLTVGKKSVLTRKENEAELGFWLGVPFWGQGLIPEAARRILRHGFEQLQLNKVWCGCREDNARPMRVQEKLGFVYSYTYENYHIKPLNLFCNFRVSCLTQSQWQKLKSDISS